MLKFETKKTMHGRYLWVEGTPVGVVPQNLPMTATLAAHLLQIRNDAHSAGKFCGRDDERRRMRDVLGLAP